MTSKKYVVTCLSCKGQSKINVINDTTPIFIDHTPIIAARFRGDLKFGFECMCGNDSRVAREEEGSLPMLVVENDPVRKQMSIAKLTESLNIKDSLKFRMEAI